MSAIQPIRQEVSPEELPARLLEVPDSNSESLRWFDAMLLWLREHSGACWTNVRWLKMVRLHDRQMLEFIGYFDEG